jgi:hypothetical protein
MNNPTKPGLYLACVYEWAGPHRERPAKPQWVIKRYCIETKYVTDPAGRGLGMKPVVEREYWQKQEYRYDTGNYENLEVVEWQELPALPGEAREKPASKTLTLGTVYVLTVDQNVPEHGGSHTVPVLAQKGSHGWDFRGWHPAFVIEGEAETYLKTLKGYNPLKIVGIPLHIAEGNLLNA